MKPTSSRQPIFNIPAAVIVLIAVLAGIEAVRSSLPEGVDAGLLARFAFVPGRFTLAFDPAAVLARWSRLASEDPDGAAAGRFFLGDGSVQPWTALTYALLHGGWTHLGLNAMWLLAFGTPVARRLGPLRFLSFMAAGALAGAAAHYAAGPASLQPLVGASASVSACMAAALRFMFRPVAPGERPPLTPVLGVFTDRRSLAFVLLWFVTNIVTGLAAVPLGWSDAPIAWQAHLGGFLLGLLALPLFDPAPHPAEPNPAEPDPEPGG